MGKAKLIQLGAKLFGFGAKAAKTTKKVVKIVPKVKSNKSVATLSKSIDKFKTSAASRKADLAKKTKTAATNTKKIKDANAATKKAVAAKRALNSISRKKSSGTKVPAAEVKKVTDASTAANLLARKTAAAKKLAEKAVAAKRAANAKKLITSRKVVITKRTVKAKKAADTKKAAPTTEPTPKVKDTSYSGTNTDTRAGKVAAYAGKKADAFGKGVAGVIKAPVKGARYIYRNPKKAVIPAAIAAVIGYGYNQNRKYNAMVKLIEGKNKPGTKPKTIYDTTLEKVDTTGQAVYNKKQKLKPRNNSVTDSTAYKKAQAHLDSLVLLQKKNRQ